MLTTFVSVSDVFQDNVKVSAIIDISKHSNTSITVDNCTFQDNKLIKQSESSPNVGLINAAGIMPNLQIGETLTTKGPQISIFNTKFIRNDLNQKKRSTGYAALIFMGGMPVPEFEYALHVHRSIFRNNKGMTTSLIVAGYLFDSDYTSSDNVANDNISSKKTALLCPGITRIRKKGGNQSYEECLVRFIEPEMTFIPTLPPTNNLSGSCWSSNFTEKVMDAEEIVVDTDQPRTYRMCNNTTIEISSYDYEEGKMNTLSIWNSNVNIVCGDDNNFHNNCTFKGGTIQIDIFERNPKLNPTTVENVRIEGFTFTNASEANIKVYGSDVEETGRSPPGASLLVKDCRFTVSCLV